VRSILIAAKQLEFAKTRLAPVLPGGERRELAEAMFRDVLAAALGTTATRHVSVVTSDAGLLAMTRAAGAQPIDEEFPRGLNVAVALGTSALIAQGAQTVCTLLSDIPLVTAEDIERSRSHGATDKEIHDTVLIAAAFCMFNRYVDGLATWRPSDPEIYREIGMMT